MAEENEVKFKVTDRRKYNADGTPREQYDEPAEPAVASPQASQPPSDSQAAPQQDQSPPQDQPQASPGDEPEYFGQLLAYLRQRRLEEKSDGSQEPN